MDGTSQQQQQQTTVAAASMSRVEANDCLIRDSQRISHLRHTEKFTNGVESVVETLLPFHVMHRKSLLDEDYAYVTGLAKRNRASQPEAETSGCRRLVGSRNDVWEAHMLKDALRVRRRLVKLAQRVKNLEGLALDRASEICEMALHVSDASVGEYVLQKRKEEEAKKKAEEEAERRLAEKREHEARMAQEEAARQVQLQQQVKPSGSIKLKLSMPSSAKLQVHNPIASSVSVHQSHAGLSGRTFSDDATEAVDIADTHRASDSRALSTDIGDDTSQQVRKGSESHYSDSDDADTLNQEKRDISEQANPPTQARVAAPPGSQTGKFKLYAMLNKKKQGHS